MYETRDRNRRGPGKERRQAERKYCNEKRKKRNEEERKEKRADWVLVELRGGNGCCFLVSAHKSGRVAERERERSDPGITEM